MIELVRCQREDGREPFTDWFRALRDGSARIKIAVRLRQLEVGNFGDSKPVGNGVIELRIHTGPGYRIYCGPYGKQWVVLLCGGDKSSQDKDIARAKEMWAEWKRRSR